MQEQGLVNVSERREKINTMVEEVERAVIEAKREWFYRGETAALKKFVALLGLVVNALSSLLAEVKPRLSPAAMIMYESMQELIANLTIQWATINLSIETLLRKEEEELSRRNPTSPPTPI